MRNSRLTVLAIAMAGILSSVALADTLSIPIISADEIRDAVDRGVTLKGYMLTTVEGYEPMRFEAEVLDVIYKSTYEELERKPFALVRFSGGEGVYSMKNLRIALGMSGSAVYVYTDKGVKYVVSRLFRNVRVKHVGGISRRRHFDTYAIAEVQLTETMVKSAEAIEAGLYAPSVEFIGDNQDNSIVVLGPYSTGSDSVELCNPFDVSTGYYTDVNDWFSRSTTMTATNTRVKMKPGSPITIYLAIGDLSIKKSGTATLVDGNTFYAVTHRVYGAGVTSLPVGIPRVVTTVPNAKASYRPSRDVSEIIGVVDLDFNWGVKGTLGKYAKMIPATFTIRNNDRKKTYRSFIADDPDVTNSVLQKFVDYILKGGYREFNMARQSEEGSVKITARLEVDGVGEIELSPYIAVYNKKTLKRAFARYAFSLRRMVLNLLSESGLSIESVTLDIEYSADYEFLKFSSVNFDHSKAVAGDSLNLFLTLRPYGNNKESRKSIPFLIPENAALGEVKVQIRSGNNLIWEKDGDGERLPTEELLGRISSFGNTSLFIKADFNKLNLSNGDGEDEGADSVLVDSLGWQTLSREQEDLPVFTVFEHILPPVKTKDRIPIIANSTLKLTIVTEEEMQQEKERLAKEEE
ncbi:hypothetical protein MYX07_02505 [Patescibacteria group bacterium AH-259-L07]|nr:hypothetical protein [Patescibacteria group bacterium AH-259-L07]